MSKIEIRFGIYHFGHKIRKMGWYSFNTKEVKNYYGNGKSQTFAIGMEKE